MEIPPLDDYEFQAAECLRAAATHRDKLLAVAVRLAGSEEAGHDLYGEAMLRCHDTIQTRGFHGDHFEFYLLKTIRNLAHPSKQKLEPHFVELTPDTVEAYADAEGTHPDARAHLADQLAEAVKQDFTAPDRMALRLHLDGESYRDIAALVGGGDHSWIARRIKKMKTALRDAFGQAWANLHAE